MLIVKLDLFSKYHSAILLYFVYLHTCLGIQSVEKTVKYMLNTNCNIVCIKYLHDCAVL